MTETLKLYTIGHGNHTAEAFVERLRQHDVRLIVDVRSAPYSKFVPHFNKTELDKWLPERAIDYRYAGQVLGGRPTQPELYRTATEVTVDTHRDDYLKLVDYEAIMRQDWYQKGIARLLQLMQETQGRVAVMCSEFNPHDCHRHHLIARSLLDPTVKINDRQTHVSHILKDGTLEAVTPQTFIDEPRQLSLF